MKNLSNTEKAALEKALSLDIFLSLYLGGGTALRIKYNHRPSLDFDFFLLPDKKFELPNFEKALRQFKIVYRDEGTIIFFIVDVKFSIFEYPYPLLQEPDKIDRILLASDKDLACMKADAISKRGLKKDFYDLWLLIKKHNWSLDNLITMLQAKYVNYNTLIFIKALTYFVEAEKTKDFAVVEEKWEEIKKFFISYIRELS